MSNEAPNDDLMAEEAAIQAPDLSKDIPDTGRAVPDKYKGKSVFDLIDMHMNSEKVLSRQGQELGELRRASDELLGFRKENAPKEKVKVTADELFTDPDKTVNQAIEQSAIADQVSQQSKKLEALERSIGQNEFEGRYPGFMSDVSNPDFQAWVMANRARAGLLSSLNNNYDFAAGTALWEMWDEYNSSPKTSAKAEKRKAIKDASTVRNAPSEGVRKPTYSRAKLMDLQVKAQRGDPAARIRWNDPAFQKEYQEAYAEGRVK